MVEAAAEIYFQRAYNNCPKLACSKQLYIFDKKISNGESLNLSTLDFSQEDFKWRNLEFHIFHKKISNGESCSTLLVLASSLFLSAILTFRIHIDYGGGQKQTAVGVVFQYDFGTPKHALELKKGLTIFGFCPKELNFYGLELKVPEVKFRVLNSFQLIFLQLFSV